MAAWAWAASVDEVLGLPRRPAGDAVGGYRAGADTSLRGRWLGRYVQPGLFSSRPMKMSLVVDVRRRDGEEEFAAEGEDDIGRFTLEGTLSSQSPVVRMTKRYVLGHAVSYSGFLEDRSFRGVWTISPTNVGLFGFHHVDVVDAETLEANVPKALGLLRRLSSALFHREPEVDVAAHNRLVRRFFEMHPELRPLQAGGPRHLF